MSAGPCACHSVRGPGQLIIDASRSVAGHFLWESLMPITLPALASLAIFAGQFLALRRHWCTLGDGQAPQGAMSYEISTGWGIRQFELQSGTPRCA